MQPVRFRSFIVTAAAGFACTAPLFATDSDDARALVEAAAEKLEALSYAVTIDARMVFQGGPANGGEMAMLVSGTIRTEQIDGDDVLGSKVYIESSMSGPAMGDVKMGFSYDGENVRAEIPQMGIFLADSAAAFQAEMPGFVEDFTEQMGPESISNPFLRDGYALEDLSVRMLDDADKELDGIACHVVEVTTPENLPMADAPGTARVWIDEKTHLIHLVETDMAGQMEMTARFLDWDISPEFGADAFTYNPGAEASTIAEMKDQEGNGGGRSELLASGAAAPSWTLATAEGTERSLSDFQGKLVLIDFWATWCGPCKAVMPEVQQLHEDFADRGLVVLGIQCWEEDTQAAVNYMSESGFTYGLLHGGDNVAEKYMVTGIPTMYLIGADGTIVKSHVGGGGMDEIRATIESYLDANGM